MGLDSFERHAEHAPTWSFLQCEGALNIYLKAAVHLVGLAAPVRMLMRPADGKLKLLQLHAPAIGHMGPAWPGPPQSGCDVGMQPSACSSWPAQLGWLNRFHHTSTSHDGLFLSFCQVGP